MVGWSLCLRAFHLPMPKKMTLLIASSTRTTRRTNADIATRNPRSLFVQSVQCPKGLRLGRRRDPRVGRNLPTGATCISASILGATRSTTAAMCRSDAPKPKWEGQPQSSEFLLAFSALIRVFHVLPSFGYFLPVFDLPCYEPACPLITSIAQGCPPAPIRAPQYP